MGRPWEVAVAIASHPLLVMAAATPNSGGSSREMAVSPASYDRWRGAGWRVQKPLTWKCVPPARWCWRARSPGRGAARCCPSATTWAFYGGVEAFTFVRFPVVTSGVTRCFSSTPQRPSRRHDEAMRERAVALNPDLTRRFLTQADPRRSVDFFLPMERAEATSWAVIAIDKAYPGQAKRAAMASGAPLPVHLHSSSWWWSTASINIS